MADQRVEDLTELTSPATADKLYILDASETETDGDTGGKSKYITYGNLTSGLGGGLTMESAQSSGFTAVAGNLYPVDLDTATSNVLVTFPSSPSAGDEFGFFVANEDTDTTVFGAAPSYGVEPASTTVIHGTTYTAETGAGVKKWGLFLQGEILVFRYYNSTKGWQVVNDGRTAHHFSANYAMTHTSTTALQKVQIQSTAVPYAHGIYASSADDTIKIRRESDTYEFGITAYGNFSAGYEIQVAVTTDPDGTPSVLMRNYNRTEYASGNIGVFCFGIVRLPNAGSEIAWQVGQTESTSKSITTSYFVREMLTI